MEEPVILVQEPHVRGKGVISKGSYCLWAIAIKTPKLPIRVSIFFHKSMERQIWPKDSMTTENYTDHNKWNWYASSVLLHGWMWGAVPITGIQSIIFLIIGNAHNTAWNSRICDQNRKERGDKLLEYIQANKLLIKNTLVTLPLLIMGGGKIRLNLQSRISLVTIFWRTGQWM